jgi:hypothetical protein
MQNLVTGFVASASLTLACASLANDESTLLTGEFTGGIEAWYDAVGTPREKESFGEYLARVALVQHGVPYDVEVPPPGEEELRVRLDRFECVSFIESSLAIARCGFRSEPTVECYLDEVVASRYRNGQREGYDSRLHYFVDWLFDNERRGRLHNFTADVGGEPTRAEFFLISERQLPRSTLPQSEIQKLRQSLVRTERRLTDTEHSVLTRDTAPDVLDRLEDGDIVAIVRERPGLLVHHAGFVYRASGVPRLLHASSYHERVVLTIEDITDYLLRRPERKGVIVSRPTAP